MCGSAYLDHIKPGGTYKPPKFHRRAKHGRAPSRMTEPATNAAVHGPPAPPSEFADDEPSSGPQHAGHFRDRLLHISNEAKHGHRKDEVKSRIVEWQPFGLSLNEIQLSTLDFGPPSRDGDHLWGSIDPCCYCTAPRKCRCQRSIAAANVQQPLAGNRTKKFEEESPLQRIGNLAKTARSPPGVGLGQPFCQLWSGHGAARRRSSSSCGGKYVGQTFDHCVEFVACCCATKTEADGTHAHLGCGTHGF